MSKIKEKDPSKFLEIQNIPKKKMLKDSLLMQGVIESIRYIKIERLIPYQNQARIFFDEEKIQSLSNSIKEYGITNPLTVVKSEIDDEKYEVISGERRLKAAIKAGLDKVPCILLEKKENSDHVALIENIQRENLHPIEMGKIFSKLIPNIFKNQNELSLVLGLNRTTVNEYIKFSNFGEEIAAKIISRGITNLLTLRKLSNIKDENEIHEILDNHNKNLNSKKSYVIVKVSEDHIKAELSKITIPQIDKLLDMLIEEKKKRVARRD